MPLLHSPATTTLEQRRATSSHCPVPSSRLALTTRLTWAALGGLDCVRLHAARLDVLFPGQHSLCGPRQTWEWHTSVTSPARALLSLTRQPPPPPGRFPSPANCCLCSPSLSPKTPILSPVRHRDLTCGRRPSMHPRSWHPRRAGDGPRGYHFRHTQQDCAAAGLRCKGTARPSAPFSHDICLCRSCCSSLAKDSATTRITTATSRLGGTKCVWAHWRRAVTPPMLQRRWKGRLPSWAVQPWFQPPIDRDRVPRQAGFGLQSTTSVQGPRRPTRLVLAPNPPVAVGALVRSLVMRESCCYVSFRQWTRASIGRLVCSCDGRRACVCAWAGFLLVYKGRSTGIFERLPAPCEATRGADANKRDSSI